MIRYYGTLGPACENLEILKKMFLQGMTGARLNLSHTSLTACEKMLEIYFKAAEEISSSAKLVKDADKEVTKDVTKEVGKETTKEMSKWPELIIDLQGPELRVGMLCEGLHLTEGGIVSLSVQVDESGKNIIPIPWEVLSKIECGQKLMLDDGKMLLEVLEDLNQESLSANKENNSQNAKVSCRVLRGGYLTSRKSIAVPECEICLPTLTAMDMENIAVAKKYGVTGVMLPFVRSVIDLQNLRKALEKAGAGDIKIFAKIENLEGVKRLEELIPACDEIVIARGDVGNSVPLWELPVVQEHIAETCKKHQKEFMVVTQMLASMEHHPVPTRAEVSDIYRAVNSGASSVMLTAETAVGEYPVEAIEYLVKTGQAAKEHYSI